MGITGVAQPISAKSQQASVSFCNLGISYCGVDSAVSGTFADDAPVSEILLQFAVICKE